MSSAKKENIELYLAARVEVRGDVQEAGRRLWFVFSPNNSDASPPPPLLLSLPVHCVKKCQM